MPDLPDDQIVAKGAACTIAYAATSTGEMPARDFLESSGKGSKTPSNKELAGLAHLFKLMAETGRISNSEQFKKEKNEIFAFKKYQARVAAFREGDTWFLTHGFKKKRDKWPPKELKRAERIRAECLARMKGK